MENRKWLRIDELAQALGISSRQLYRWEIEGMPSLLIGKARKRYNLEEVVEWRRKSCFTGKAVR